MTSLHIPPRPEKKFTLGSLFSGIGGLELGLEMTGRFETVWQVEQSEYCRKILRRHWPDAIQFEDVKDVGIRNLPAVDVVCGGFPCQDISNAGRQAGILAGNRSGLWYEYARIIRELRPRYVIVENVSALLARGLDVVLGELAEIGYDAEWTVLSAADVGAPHLRERVFLVAYPDRLRVESPDRRCPNRTPSTFARSVTVGASSKDEVAHAFSVRQPRQGEPLNISGQTPHREGQAGNALNVSLGYQWSVEPAVGRSLDGFSVWLDSHRINEAHKLYCAYGNAAEERPKEIMRAVRTYAGSLDDGHQAGGQGGVSSSSVLFAYVRELARHDEEGDVPLASATTTEVGLRSLRNDAKPTGASCRPRSPQQPIEQHSNALQDLPRFLAFHAEAAWTAYGRENAPTLLSPWRSGWEDGIPRVANGIPNRVHRLTALGNAVVPQCARVIGEWLLEIDRELNSESAA